MAVTRWKTLWRMEDMFLPPTVDYLFLHCGTNNLHSSSPKDIADGILAIGKKETGRFKGFCPWSPALRSRCIDTDKIQCSRDKGFEAENPGRFLLYGRRL